MFKSIYKREKSFIYTQHDLDHLTDWFFRLMNYFFLNFFSFGYVYMENTLLLKIRNKKNLLTTEGKKPRQSPRVSIDYVVAIKKSDDYLLVSKPLQMIFLYFLTLWLDKMEWKFLFNLMISEIEIGFFGSEHDEKIILRTGSEGGSFLHLSS